MGREVAVLRDGRLVQTASPAALYRDPVDLEVAHFVGDAVVLAGTARDGAVECALGTLPVRNQAGDGEVRVMIRPEQIRFAPGAAAEVLGRSYRGPDTVVQLVLRGDDRAQVTVRTFDQQLPAPGDLVGLDVVGSVAVYPR